MSTILFFSSVWNKNCVAFSPSLSLSVFISREIPALHQRFSVPPIEILFLLIVPSLSLVKIPATNKIAIERYQRFGSRLHRILGSFFCLPLALSLSIWSCLSSFHSSTLGLHHSLEIKLGAFNARLYINVCVCVCERSHWSDSPLPCTLLHLLPPSSPLLIIIVFFFLLMIWLARLFVAVFVTRRLTLQKRKRVTTAILNGLHCVYRRV